MTSTDPMKEKERELYEKWKAEHPDVAHPLFVENDTFVTRPEWWVRNYVETRLLPYIAHRDAALVEKVRGMKWDEADDWGEPRNKERRGRNAALDAVISLITNREKV